MKTLALALFASFTLCSCTSKNKVQSGEYLSADNPNPNGPAVNVIFSHTIYHFENGAVSLSRVLDGAIFPFDGGYGIAKGSNARKGQNLAGYGDSVAILGRGDKVPILTNAKYTEEGDKIVIDWSTGQATEFTTQFGDYGASRVGLNAEVLMLSDGGKKLASKTFPGVMFEYFGTN